MPHVAIVLLMIEYYRFLIETFQFFEMLQEYDDLVLTAASRLSYVEVASTAVQRSTPLRIREYVEIIIPGQTAKQFQENFRMTPCVFEIVFKVIGEQLKQMNKFSAVTKLMDPRKQFLAVLWLLATPDSYRSVAERFNMGKSSVHKLFINIVKILNGRSRNFIKWPQGSERETANIFQNYAGIPGVIGAVDGTYIAIKAPKEYPERYINRKCYHANTLQTICDAHMAFTDVFTGYPSSVSDRRIFRNSDIYNNITDGSLIVPENYYILGDNAYPILNWCIPPFIERRPLSQREKKFNVAVAQTRQVIERAFALLKGRFRRLKYLDMSMTEFIPQTILACCVLHNICLYNDKNMEVIRKYIEEGMPSVDGEDQNRESVQERAHGRGDLRYNLMNQMGL